MKITIFIILLSFSLSEAIAQNPPPGQESGPQAERFKAGVEEEKERLEEKKAKPAEIEIQKEKEEKPALEAVSFTLKDIKITGTTVFDLEDFRSIYEPYLTKKQPLKILRILWKR